LPIARSRRHSRRGCDCAIADPALSPRARLTRFGALVPDPICSRPACPSTRPTSRARW